MHGGTEIGIHYDPLLAKIIALQMRNSRFVITPRTTVFSSA
jgi:hypothetical protein